MERLLEEQLARTRSDELAEVRPVDLAVEVPVPVAEPRKTPSEMITHLVDVTVTGVKPLHGNAAEPIQMALYEIAPHYRICPYGRKALPNSYKNYNLWLPPMLFAAVSFDNKWWEPYLWFRASEESVTDLSKMRVAAAWFPNMEFNGAGCFHIDHLRGKGSFPTHKRVIAELIEPLFSYRWNSDIHPTYRAMPAEFNHVSRTKADYAGFLKLWEKTAPEDVEAALLSAPAIAVGIKELAVVLRTSLFSKEFARVSWPDGDIPKEQLTTSRVRNARVTVHLNRK